MTVSHEPSGKYFACLLFCCENQAVEKRPAEKFLGIDFAMHGLGAFSTGEKADYPMFYRRAEKKLAREQRKDFQHKLSSSLEEIYDAVCVEDLT